MLVRSLPNQIPHLWDAIKLAAISSNHIEEKDRQFYLNRLLNALLSDKAQCFVRLDEDRKLLAVEVTRIVLDEVTGEKALFLESLYSFKPVSDDEWRKDFEVAKKFAISQGCKKITTYATTERVYELAESVGFKERFRGFSMEV